MVKSPKFQGRLLNLKLGAAQPYISLANLRTFKFEIIPEKSVQKLIGKTLLLYDVLIHNNQRRIALLEQAARLLYKEWFVHLRFPGHEHIKINDGVPRGWQRLPFGDLLVLHMLATNREKYTLLKDGVQVTYRNVKGELYRRRADIVGFVNGIPLLFMEFKNVSKDIRAAYEKNLADYKDTVPHLFHHNAFIVLANGVDAKIGSVSSRFEHFHEWKRLEEDEAGAVNMETLLKGICDKRNFMDLFENFIVFDDSRVKW